MQFLDSRTIKLDRILSELDKVVIDFVKLLEKHTDYVIVSGYVAILFGRTRTTEDIDIIIPKMPEEKFHNLFVEITEKGMWFLNSSIEKDLYEILCSKSGIRAAEDGEITPNFEVKFEKTEADRAALSNKILVKMNGSQLQIAPLELQILYKEKVLKSFKDIEDARHLRLVFDKFLSSDSFKSYLKAIQK